MSQSSLFGRRFAKILVCQQRQIGDVLLATPAVHMLRKAQPQAELHFLTEKKCAPVLQYNPDINVVWEIDKKQLTNLGKELAFYHRVARQGFDLVVDFQQLPRLQWVVLFSRASVRLSYNPPWQRRFLYTHWTDMQPGYAAQTKASILRPLGIEWNGEKPRINLSEDEQRQAAQWLREQGLRESEQLITVDPSHRRITRLWPAEYFARLIDLAAERDASLRFLLLFGPGEESAVREVAGLVRRKEALLPIGRMLSLREMAAVLGLARLHVGNCSSPAHFAVAVDTPTLVVRGSTGDEWRYPSPKHRSLRLGLPCQPCNKSPCPLDTRQCLVEFTAERVSTSLFEMLAAETKPRDLTKENPA